MNRYLRPSRSMPRIYLYRDPVDFRNYVQSKAVNVHGQ